MFQIEEKIYPGKHPLPKVFHFLEESKGYLLIVVCWGPDDVAEGFHQVFNENFEHLDKHNFSSEDILGKDNNESEETNIVLEPKKTIHCHEALLKATAQLYDANKSELLGYVEVACFIKNQTTDDFTLFQSGAPSTILKPAQGGLRSLSSHNPISHPEELLFLPQYPLGFQETPNFHKITFEIQKTDRLILLLTNNCHLPLLEKKNWLQALSKVNPKQAIWASELILA